MLTACIATALPSQAATLEQVVRALTPPLQATASATATGWPAVERLSVKWHHVGLKQTPMGFTRFGTLQLDGLGKTSVFFHGSRGEPHHASLSLPRDKAVDKSEFAVTVKRLLPAARLEQVRAGCKNEGVLGGSAVYRVMLQGQQPAYVLMAAGTSKMGLDTSIDIAPRLGKDWSCAP